MSDAPLSPGDLQGPETSGAAGSAGTPGAHVEPWPDTRTRSSLQVYVDSLSRFTGFTMAAISLLREDGHLHVAAVAGADAVAESEIRRLRAPLALVLELVRDGEEWGRFRFIPEGSRAVEDDWCWVPAHEPLDCPDAWHPEDVLIAPLYDDHGMLVGALSLDLPADGRRPDATGREALNRVARQASRAIVATIERRAIASQVALAQAARTVVHEATTQAGLEDDFAAVSVRLQDLFGLAHVRVAVFDPATSDIRVVSTVEDGDDMVDHATMARVTQRLWAEQQVIVISHHQSAGSPSGDIARRIQGYLDDLGAGSLLSAPIGEGEEALGLLSLIRPAGAVLWSAQECAAVLEICRDLGRVLVNARLAREQDRLVAELRQIDSRRSRLIRTLAHELKNPLTVLAGNLELLQSDAVLPAERSATLGRMAKAAERMTRLVEDLAALPRPGGGLGPAGPHDLSGLVREACTLLDPRSQGLRLVTSLPATPVPVVGDTEALDRVVMNLIGNAVKYTDAGGTVDVTLSAVDPWVELTVSDSGIGIDPDDQHRLFHEFYRGANVGARPGTGLGLSIAARTIGGLGGSIELHSELGRGSSFRARFPLVPSR